MKIRGNLIFTTHALWLTRIMGRLVDSYGFCSGVNCVASSGIVRTRNQDRLSALNSWRLFQICRKVRCTARSLIKNDLRCPFYHLSCCRQHTGEIPARIMLFHVRGKLQTQNYSFLSKYLVILLPVNGGHQHLDEIPLRVSHGLPIVIHVNWDRMQYLHWF